MTIDFPERYNRLVTIQARRFFDKYNRSRRRCERPVTSDASIVFDGQGALKLKMTAVYADGKEHVRLYPLDEDIQALVNSFEVPKWTPK